MKWSYVVNDLLHNWAEVLQRDLKSHIGRFSRHVSIIASKETIKILIDAQKTSIRYN